MTRHNNHKQFIQIGSEAILDAIGDAISIQDKDLKVIYQNKSHVSMMGSHRGEYCYTAELERFQKEIMPLLMGMGS